MKNTSRLSALVLLIEPLTKLLRAKKQRSTNIVVEDAISLALWINKKVASRGFRDSTILTIMDCQAAADLDISPRRVKNAKSLLKDVGAIKFFKKIKNGDSWTHLWSLTLEFCRAVYVSNGYHRIGSERKYHASKKKMSYEFIIEENNIFAIVQDSDGPRSIFRKHLKAFEKQRLAASKRVASAVQSTRVSIDKIRKESHDFIDKYLEVNDGVLIDF